MRYLFIAVITSILLNSSTIFRGVGTTALSYYYDKSAVEFIIREKIPSVRIHIYILNTMKKLDVDASEALELNLKWSKEIYQKLNDNNISSMITISDFPLTQTKCIDKKKPIYWSSKECVNQIYTMVKRTVNEFKSSNLIGYEFLGEPVVEISGKSLEPTNWNDIFKNIIKITRKVDRDKYLFYSVAPWGIASHYSKVKPFNDDKIIYNAHMYQPHKYTHQQVRKIKNEYSYPLWIWSKRWNRDKLYEQLKPLIDFGKKYNKPISISEFSVILWAENSNVYLKDLLDIFEENSISWYYFNIGSIYKGWDARYSGRVDNRFRKHYNYKGSNSKRFKLLKRYLGD
ncbi:Endoglucanase [hydrothermal vent metagenome]|uniref:Endoglucanase n=1 Tax=hydrothermal vent metagenome TaxID=652676 RepID=A0A1W1EIT2_9ZZZZ